MSVTRDVAGNGRASRTPDLSDAIASTENRLRDFVGDRWPTWYDIGYGCAFGVGPTGRDGPGDIAAARKFVMAHLRRSTRLAALVAPGYREIYEVRASALDDEGKRREEILRADLDVSNRASFISQTESRIRACENELQRLSWVGWDAAGVQASEARRELQGRYVNLVRELNERVVGRSLPALDVIASESDMLVARHGELTRRLAEYESRLASEMDSNRRSEILNEIDTLAAEYERVRSIRAEAARRLAADIRELGTSPLRELADATREALQANVLSAEETLEKLVAYDRDDNRPPRTRVYLGALFIATVITTVAEFAMMNKNTLAALGIGSLSNKIKALTMDDGVFRLLASAVDVVGAFAFVAIPFAFGFVGKWFLDTHDKGGKPSSIQWVMLIAVVVYIIGISTAVLFSGADNVGVDTAFAVFSITTALTATASLLLHELLNGWAFRRRITRDVPARCHSLQSEVVGLQQQITERRNQLETLHGRLADQRSELARAAASLDALQQAAEGEESKDEDIVQAALAALDLGYSNGLSAGVAGSGRHRDAAANPSFDELSENWQKLQLLMSYWGHGDSQDSFEGGRVSS